MSINYKTPDYFLEFSCLGGDCEDNCCKGWDIRLDRHHYEALRDKMSGDAEQKIIFERFIKLNQSPVMDDDDYAHIQMTENGTCPMEAKDGLCNLHREYGQELLGNVCAFFPRVISRCGQDMEMTAALSCPEVARLCLLNDKKVRMGRFSPSQLPRPRNYPVSRELPAPSSDYYAAGFRQVRQNFQDLLALEQYSFDTRLFALATFANHISAFYHKDCEALNEAALHESITDINNTTVLDNLQNTVTQYVSSEPIALIVIHSILQIKLQQFPGEKLSILADSVFNHYHKLYSETVTDADRQMDINDLQDSFSRSRDEIQASFGKRLDQYFSRYLNNCLFREWFYTMPDSFTYIQMLIIRLAILRFLVYSHPRLLELQQQWQGRIKPDSELPDEVQKVLDEVIVSVVYSFARAIDQNLPFLQVVYNAVSEQQMMNFDYSLAFIRL